MKKQNLHIGDYVRVINGSSTNGHILRVTEIRTITFKGEDLTDKKWGVMTYAFHDVEPIEYRQNPILQ